MDPRIPILFLSDSVSCTSGLGRITRDLATRVHQYLGDMYEVASVGYGGAGKSSIPFREYHLHSIANWLVPELPDVWDDFAQGREGILMTIWDASRLYWMGIPSLCPQPALRRFAERKDIRKWLYGAIDAEGPNGGLSHRIRETYKGFDRVIEYSAFASEITGYPDHLPHGIDASIFKPLNRKDARQEFAKAGFQGLTEDSFLVGVVATNQARKNWALAFQTAKILLDRGKDVRMWAHTDQVQRHWDIGNLVVDYGLENRVAVTLTRFTDDQLAAMYSACDVTLGIGPEGFGYPIAESLACGVPCISGSYGAQAEFVPEVMQIEPENYYYEGAFCSKRPIHNPFDWADKAEQLALWRAQAASTSLLPECVDWNGNTLWPAWRRWFEEGLK